MLPDLIAIHSEMIKREFTTQNIYAALLAILSACNLQRLPADILGTREAFAEKYAHNAFLLENDLRNISAMLAKSEQSLFRQFQIALSSSHTFNITAVTPSLRQSASVISWGPYTKADFAVFSQKPKPMPGEAPRLAP